MQNLVRAVAFFEVLDLDRRRFETLHYEFPPAACTMTG